MAVKTQRNKRDVAFVLWTPQQFKNVFKVAPVYLKTPHRELITASPDTAGPGAQKRPSRHASSLLVRRRREK